MADETVFMLYSLLLGIIITFIYDLLRIFRRVIAHNIFWISVEDICFWGFCATEVFLLMYHVSNGTMRWFAVMGALAGMLVYNQTVSRFLVKYLSLVLKKILGGIRKILRIIFKPVTMAAGAAGRTAGKAAGQGKRFCSFLKKRLTAGKKVLTMVVCKK